MNRTHKPPPGTVPLVFAYWTMSQDAFHCATTAERDAWWQRVEREAIEPLMVIQVNARAINGQAPDDALIFRPSVWPVEMLDDEDFRDVSAASLARRALTDAAEMGFVLSKTRDEVALELWATTTDIVVGEAIRDPEGFKSLIAAARMDL